MESKKVVQHVYLVGAKSIYRVAEKDKEYLRDEEEKNQNTACGASCWRRGSLHPNASQVFGCAMDAFVFPSTWEGLGIVAIEAQASGLECYLSRELPKEVEVTDAVTWFDVSENENCALTFLRC